MSGAGQRSVDSRVLSPGTWESTTDGNHCRVSPPREVLWYKVIVQEEAARLPIREPGCVYTAMS